MSEITEAIQARQAQILQLQNDIETLQRAAGVLGGKTIAQGQPTTKSKPKRKRRRGGTEAKAAGQPKTTRKRKRPTWSAADKRAISKRMKAYWAKRRKAKG